MSITPSLVRLGYGCQPGCRLPGSNPQAVGARFPDPRFRGVRWPRRESNSHGVSHITMLTRVAEGYVHAPGGRLGDHRDDRLHSAAVAADAGRVAGMVAQKSLDVVHLDRAVARIDQFGDPLLPGNGIRETQLKILRGAITLAEKMVGMDQISGALIAKDFRTRGCGFHVGNVPVAVANDKVLVGRQRQLP